ncbi:pyridoxamine 5'-phosphate oxidase family protein [Parasphingorhabdus cellanae]|uniref:Pyridoxamine 5'-phosphate oxidase family protein n=1 Tax=Parasphingorhabdus cellanae TaxID=2806553 RepID=A0ABX7T652_9SPHN|nr:pyridoxamine 5'-phosphate oxidase family protein [Parasphingorhabdus cellanae]QTD57070.1 pyridoxamine 5'-phosphate oxidase family protein [Parasphingorhabdus cellanae]
MPYKFLDMLTTDSVRDAQSENGAREQWDDFAGDRRFDHFDERAAAFIAARDSFYMASVSENGWPYVQHRGGPPGFLKVLDDKMLGFADFQGNRQYISLGNVKADDRVALFLVDYPRRKRLKLLAHMTVHQLDDNPDLAQRIIDTDYQGQPERLMTLSLESYDWNCPQHIVPRFTKDMVDLAARPLQEEIARLTEENEALRRKLG